MSDFIKFAETYLGIKFPWYYKAIAGSAYDPDKFIVASNRATKKTAMCLMIKFLRQMGEEVTLIQPFPCWKNDRPKCFDFIADEIFPPLKDGGPKGYYVGELDEEADRED